MTNYEEERRQRHQRSLDYNEEAAAYQRAVIDEARDSDAPRVLIISYLETLAEVEKSIEFYEALLR